MIIQIKKFGVTLTSRDDGKEAYAAIQPVLKSLSPDETIELDFDGVNTFTPSWGDEFITGLYRDYDDRLILGDIDNRSVVATIAMLEKANRIFFNRKSS